MTPDLWRALALWGPGLLILAGFYLLALRGGRGLALVFESTLVRMVAAQEKQSQAVADLTVAIRSQAARDDGFQDQQRVLLDLCLQEIRALRDRLAGCPADGCLHLENRPRAAGARPDLKECLECRAGRSPQNDG